MAKEKAIQKSYGRSGRSACAAGVRATLLNLLLVAFASVLLSTLCKSTAHAEYGDSQSGFGLPFDVGFSESIGTLAGANSSFIPSCSIYSSSVFLETGIRYNRLSFLIRGEYLYVMQSTPLSQVNNINLSGTGTLGAAGVGFNHNLFAMELFYYPVGTYTLSQPNIGGQTTSFSSPNGFELDAGFMPLESLTLSLVYRNLQYAVENPSGSNNTLLQNSQFGISLRWGL